MRNSFVILACLVAFGLSARAASASVISWGSVNPITGPGSTTVSTAPTNSGTGATIYTGTDDVVTTGTSVLAINFSGLNTGGGYTTTIDGTTFSPVQSNTGPNQAIATNPYTQSGITESNDLSDANGPFVVGAAAQSYGYFNAYYGTDYTLDNSIIYGGNSPGESPFDAEIMFSGLTPGHEYLLQFWVSDPTNAEDTEVLAGDYFADQGGTNTSPALAYSVDGGDGSWVTGTFTAEDDGNQNLYLADQGGAPEFNLLQLRDLGPAAVPEPSAVILFGLGAIGMFAVARRRLAAKNG